MFLDRVASGQLSMLSGADAFKLSDTYGFPLDLTMEIAAERGIKVDEAQFRELMEKQKSMARADRASKVKTSWSNESIADISAPKTEFVGYTQMSCGAKILGIFADGKQVDSISEGTDAALILDRTPFYAESGGQVADTGEIVGNGAFAVADVK